VLACLEENNGNRHGSITVEQHVFSSLSRGFSDSLGGFGVFQRDEMVTRGSGEGDMWLFDVNKR
jgi:hypothetical protein